MALSWRLCLTVRGIIIARTITVKTRMLIPKLEKKMPYNSTRLLIIGWIMIRFQMSTITSNVQTPSRLPYSEAGASAQTGRGDWQSPAVSACFALNRRSILARGSLVPW